VEAHYLLGVSSFWMGAFIASRTHLQEAVSHYDPQWHQRNIDLYAHDSGAICLVRLAFTLWVLGYPEQSATQSRAALALAQEQKHLFGLTYVHGYSAWLYREWGELALAAKENEAMLTLCSQHGISFWSPMGWIVRGGLLVTGGEMQLGLAEIGRGLAGFETEELNLQRPYVLAVAAQAHATAGQWEKGLALVEAGLSASQQTKEHFWDAELHRLRGLLLLAGETTAADEAEVAFQHALIVAAEQGAKSLELRAALDLARLWQAQGRLNAARMLLAPIYNWFSEGFATPALREARALLDLLA
jgi:predicted ATPase